MHTARLSRIPLVVALALALAPLLVMAFALSGACVDGCATELRIHASGDATRAAGQLKALAPDVLGRASRWLAAVYVESPRYVQARASAVVSAPLRL